MNRPHGRLDFVGIAVVGTAACTRWQHAASAVRWTCSHAPSQTH